MGSPRPSLCDARSWMSPATAAGRPIYVQRRGLDDARSEDDYTLREWVEAPGLDMSRKSATCWKGEEHGA